MEQELLFKEGTHVPEPSMVSFTVFIIFSFCRKQLYQYFPCPRTIKLTEKYRLPCTEYKLTIFYENHF